MIIAVERKKILVSLGFILVTFLFGISFHPALENVLARDFDFRIFVAGVGTVEGKWCQTTGLAIIGLETRPSPVDGQDLKIIDLLVANNGSAPLLFDADINLVTKQGKRFGLTAAGQPQVVVNPGEISQGTVMINVPEGMPDDQWVLEIKGGSLHEGVTLPIVEPKIKAKNHATLETIKMQEGIFWRQ